MKNLFDTKILYSTGLGMG